MQGLGISLGNATALSTTFAAPSVDSEAAVTFTLTATDENGAAGSDTVTVTVRDAPSDPPANVVVLEPIGTQGPRDIGTITLNGSLPGTIQATWEGPSEDPANYRIMWAKVGELLQDVGRPVGQRVPDCPRPCHHRPGGGRAVQGQGARLLCRHRGGLERRAGHHRAMTLTRVARGGLRSAARRGAPDWCHDCRLLRWAIFAPASCNSWRTGGAVPPCRFAPQSQLTAPGSQGATSRGIAMTSGETGHAMGAARRACGRAMRRVAALREAVGQAGGGARATRRPAGLAARAPTRRR